MHYKMGGNKKVQPTNGQRYKDLLKAINTTYYF
jgi:hypothetical protein